MRILVLGASGMLGNAILRLLSGRAEWTVYGTLRSENTALSNLAPAAKLIPGIHTDHPDSLVKAFGISRPQIVINCVGLVKQLASAADPLEAIPVNAILPHRLAKLSALANSRFIHVSTDCVFSGRVGLYSEMDQPDAEDVYGRSKLLGEVDYPHAITLRTSIIGHEMGSRNGLVEWFLAQQGGVRGYTGAIFSGLPTSELARVIMEFVIPNSDLHGVYHVAAEPISKYELLQIVGREYMHNIDIAPDGNLKIDRSLDASKFKVATGYVAPPWIDLIKSMRAFR